MGFTISKRKQPTGSSFMKEGATFYRIKSNGVYLEDFKTKKQAQAYIKKLNKDR